MQLQRCAGASSASPSPARCPCSALRSTSRHDHTSSGTDARSSVGATAVKPVDLPWSSPPGGGEDMNRVPGRPADPHHAAGASAIRTSSRPVTPSPGPRSTPGSTCPPIVGQRPPTASRSSRRTSRSRRGGAVTRTSAFSRTRPQDNGVRDARDLESSSLVREPGRRRRSVFPGGAGGRPVRWWSCAGSIVSSQESPVAALMTRTC